MNKANLSALFFIVSVAVQAAGAFDCALTNIYEFSHWTMTEERDELTFRYSAQAGTIQYPDLIDALKKSNMIKPSERLVEIEVSFPKATAEFHATDKLIMNLQGVKNRMKVRLSDSRGMMPKWTIERDLDLHWAEFQTHRVAEKWASGISKRHVGELRFYANPGTYFSTVTRTLNCNP